MPAVPPNAARPPAWSRAILPSLLAALLAGGCAAPMNERRDASYQERAPVADRPVVRPTRSISSFSESLVCMDYMLRNAELPTTLITSKQIPDYSAKVPVATKDMIITALSQMSRLSNTFRFVDYEVDIARQDTVQNLTTIMLNTNQLQLQRPALYLSGAISFVDQNVLNNRFDVGVSGGRIDAAYSKSRNASIIGLEMHLGDFRTRTLIPGMDSANEVVVGTGGQGLDLAGRIGSYGVQFTVGRDYTQGAGAAVRTLVELATIELVGKWARVPYWQCLTLDQTHPEFQRQLREWFDADEPAARAQLVRQSLASRGYLRADSGQGPGAGPALREAIARFQADGGMIVTGVVDFPTYERALRDFAGLGPDGTLTRIGWATIPAATAATDTAVATAGVALPYDPGGRRVRTLDMQIENIKASRSAFEVGEQVFLSAVVSHAAFLSCYHVNALGAVVRLLPNRWSRAMWVPANHAVRIPDWMSPNPGFVMDAESPGTEGVACFATDDDDVRKLPEALRGDALRPIAGYATLADIDKAFAQGWGPAGYTSNALQWQVEPRLNGTAR